MEAAGAVCALCGENAGETAYLRERVRALTHELALSAAALAAEPTAAAALAVASVPLAGLRGGSLNRSPSASSGERQPGAFGWREQRRHNYLFGDSGAGGGGSDGGRPPSRASVTSSSLSAHARATQQLRSKQRQLRGEVAGAGDAVLRSSLAWSPLAQPLRRPAVARPTTAVLPLVGAGPARGPPVPPGRAPKHPPGSAAARLAETPAAASVAATVAAALRRQAPVAALPAAMSQAAAPAAAPPTAQPAMPPAMPPVAAPDGDSIDSRLSKLFAFLREAQAAGASGALPPSPSYSPAAALFRAAD